MDDEEEVIAFGEADLAHADAEDEDEQLAAFWATPMEQRRGIAPWVWWNKYFENLLVRAPVPEIKRALLAYEPLRPLPASAALEQAPDNTPVRTRQFRPTALAVPQPTGQRLTFARPRGHNWSQVRGGHRLGGKRAFSNEALVRYLSSALGTKAFLYGHESVSAITYYSLYGNGQEVWSANSEEDEADEAAQEVIRREKIFDPDADWMLDEDTVGEDDEPVLRLVMAWDGEEEEDQDQGSEGASQGYRPEEFVEVDTLTFEAVEDAE